jgi:nitrilase
MTPAMRIAAAQIAPIYLDRAHTLEKVCRWIDKAAHDGARLVCFGETLVPGYPAYLCRTDGARFDAPDQKALHARYLDQAVCIERGDLDVVRARAQARSIVVVLGVAERPLDRGGHSVYCSRVIIGADGAILSVHRKLMPTYEERLCWGEGDGAGLVTHPVAGFTLSALNCWENWMPLARAALYAQGANLHVALWPGGDYNTRDITRFIAREGRTYCVSVCGLLRPDDIPADVPERERILAGGEAFLLSGGTAIAGPDGEWLAEPMVGEERLVTAEIDLARVYEERQNFDPAGHYARADVLSLSINRERQGVLRFED